MLIAGRLSNIRVLMKTPGLHLIPCSRFFNKYSLQPQRIINHHVFNVSSPTLRFFCGVPPDKLLADIEVVKSAKNNPGIYLVDVREPSEIQETGIIPGAVNIPLGEFKSAISNLSEAEFKKKYGREPPCKDSNIITYCKIGKRSGTAQEEAIKQGFKNVRNYRGSWTEWAEKHNLPS